MPVKDAARLAQKLADELQLELVDVELVKEPTGRFLRFFVDTEKGVSVDELENFHRRILPLVERVDYDYMEVSSPGRGRPLKTERDFERAQGVRVELNTYRAVGKAKQKHFVGELVGLIDGNIVLLTDEGQQAAFPRREVAVVRPLIEFDESDLDAFFPEERRRRGPKRIGGLWPWQTAASTRASSSARSMIFPRSGASIKTCSLPPLKRR